MSISLPTGEVGVDVFGIDIKFSQSMPWINIADEATTVSALDASSSGAETVTLKAGSGRAIRFQTTPSDLGTMTAQVGMFFSLSETSAYDIFLNEWLGAQRRGELPQIWMRVCPGGPGSQRWFYTSKDWATSGAGSMTQFSPYGELAAATNNDVVRSSFTVTYDAVHVKNVENMGETAEASILPHVFYGSGSGGGGGVTPDPVPDTSTINDEDFLQFSHINDKRFPLSTTPSPQQAVRVYLSGIPQYETRGDFILMVDDGVTYVSWDGKALEPLVRVGDGFRVTYTRGV